MGCLDEREIEPRSLHKAIDTTTPTGKLTVHAFHAFYASALAEFERPDPTDLVYRHFA